MSSSRFILTPCLAILIFTGGLNGPAVAQENAEPVAPGEGRIVFLKEAEVPDDARNQFESGFEWGESQEAKDAKAKAEAEAAAAAAAAEKAELEAQLEAARMEAEKAKAEADAARKQAEAEAKAAEEARAMAEAEAKAAEEARAKAEAEAKAAEEARNAAAAEAEKRAEAEAARKRAEAEAAKAAAEAEAAAAAAEQVREPEMAAVEPEPEAAESTEPASEPEPAAPPKPRPTGTLASIEIDSAATRDDLPGVSVSVEGQASRIKGTRIETAAYFFDAEGNPLKDSDQEFRSAKGDVYVGEYRTADAEPFSWSEELFIPVQQLELGEAAAGDVQVQVIIWEYSDRRGKILAKSDLSSFTIALQPTVAEVRASIAGQWSDGVTITVENDIITVDGLDVRGNIQSANWMLDGNVLRGVLEISRRIGADRTATYELTLSEDGNLLAGNYVVAAGPDDVRDEGTITLTR